MNKKDITSAASFRRECWLWLCSEKELYQPHITKLLKYFGSPELIYRASEKDLLESHCLKASQVRAICRGRADWDPVRYRYRMQQQGIRFADQEQEGFPQRLRSIPDCPYGIFYRGKLPDDGRKSVAIVGARQCSYYGKRMAERLAVALAESGVQIISGMALGVDGYAQMAALQAGGDSYAVLGCGADICYPAKNRPLYRQLTEGGGGVLTELPPGREALALHFPLRNRIISGLSDCLLVTEAKLRSGSLITADLALEQGKDVYAVPGRIGDTLSAGCNRLIAQGAGIILSEEELLEELNLIREEKFTEKKPVITLASKEKLLYSCLDLRPRGLQELVSATGLPMQEAMALLTSLEMKGLVAEPTKNRYARI